jgi:Fe-S cluster assembly ATP-binding protein
MLTIKNLHADIEGQQILKGINLEVKPGEVHAIMGPNGSGKSTLASVLAGREEYEVSEGARSLSWEKIYWTWLRKTGPVKVYSWRFNILWKFRV